MSDSFDDFTGFPQDITDDGTASHNTPMPDSATPGNVNPYISPADETQAVSSDTKPEQAFIPASSHNDSFVSRDSLGGTGSSEQQSAPQSTPVVAQAHDNTTGQDSGSQPVAASSCEWYGLAAQHGNTSATVKTQSRQCKEKKGSFTGIVALLIAVCIVTSCICGFGGAYLSSLLSGSASSGGSGLSINKVSSDNNNSAGSATGTQLSTVEIVNKSADSVVEITTESVQTGSFSQQYISSGAGSGVIVDENGYIITNNHVIDNATKITVTLKNSKSYEGKLVGADAKTDVALVKIEATGLSAAVFGDSDELSVGEKTVAIGNPLGQLGGSVTEGIISALNRDVVIDGQTMSLLQTDTAINPGNSGGGLFNANGNLVGVVNAKSSGSEIEGLGFAIPINDVVEVMSDLLEYGYVRGRIDLGMTFVDVNSQQAAWMYGLSDLGCYIYRVDSDSNAAQAGFASGDLIVKVNGTKVMSSDNIESIIDDLDVGAKATFTIERSGRTGEIELTLEEYVPESAKQNSDGSIQWQSN